MFKRRGIAVAVSALAVAGVAPAAHSAASTGTAKAAKKCSAKGLRFQTSNGYFTSSVKVRKLVARNGASCGKARKIARVVAKKLLADKAVPKKVKGFKVKVTAPCAGCTPITKVKARKGSAKRITFKVAGGA